MTIDLLPDSRAKLSSKSMMIDTPYGPLPHVPVYCANCGMFCFWVTEENCTFISYLCEGPATRDCAKKWAPLFGTMAVPDEVFFKRVEQEMQEKYGRQLSVPELVEVLKDENSTLSKLGKDRPGMQ